MSIKKRVLGLLLIAVIVLVSSGGGNGGESNLTQENIPAGSCARFAAGSTVTDPANLFSHNGTLRVSLSYNTGTDRDGRTLFCFTTPDGKESPTLHMHPGDHLIVHVKNNLPAPTSASAMQMSTSASDVCGAATMDASSVNIHYHGTNTSPKCHQDEVIHTTINSGESFTYNVAFPTNEPPGLYWYHPHIHGIAEAAVQGGASGAIVVEGLEKVQPAVAGLRQRILIIRDQNVAGNPAPGGPNNIPSWDLSLNYVPIPYPDYTPAVINMKPEKKELWRVVNASADTIADLQLQYDGQSQTLAVVGLDGVPTGSQDGTRRGKILNETDILLPPAARAEFIVTPPSSTVRNATLLTLGVDTGPNGDNDPQRPLAMIDTSLGEKDRGAESALKMPAVTGAPGRQRFEGLADATPTAQRKLYFSEVLSDPSNPLSPTNFFITVDGATPQVFNPSNPPTIVTTQGSVEDWTIENRSLENHEFHIHQIHFLVLSQNNFEINGSQPVSGLQGQFLDMIQVPYWDGNPNHPYPSVTVRMDFRGPDTGDFVYHCHILGHEDNGMMAMIRVEPSSAAAVVDRLRITLASIRRSTRREANSISAWCVRGRLATRPSRLRLGNSAREASVLRDRSSSLESFTQYRFN
jgi:FtsP/CotA-like multicopper oxidase with cupredoxin domain